MKIQEEVDGEESLEMARKERGEFVFSAFSSFLLAWPVRRLVMHDRCRYVYSVGCTRSGAKHRWKSPLLPFDPSFLLPIYPSYIKRMGARLRFTFVSRSVEVRAREIQKIEQSDRFPNHRQRTFFKWTISWNPTRHFSPWEIHRTNGIKIWKPSQPASHVSADLQNFLLLIQI